MIIISSLKFEQNITRIEVNPLDETIFTVLGSNIYKNIKLFEHQLEVEEDLEKIS